MLGSEADACHAYFELFPKMIRKYSVSLVIRTGELGLENVENNRCCWDSIL